MSAFALTVRHGSQVSRERFEKLDAALDAMRKRVEEMRGEGPLESVTMFRDYSPEVRVAGRVELSTGGWLRGSDAGIDVMGDGTLVAYSGGIRKQTLDGDDPFEAVRKAMR